MAEIKIRLTENHVIAVDEGEWPLIGSAEGDSSVFYPGITAEERDRAVNEREVDFYFIGVRQHADGRAIVYAWFDASEWTRHESWEGGELLLPGNDLVAALKRVGNYARLPNHIILEAIDSLQLERV